jgi:hypothetical protein
VIRVFRRTYAAKALPAWCYDDGPAAQQRQENAKALRRFLPAPPDAATVFLSAISHYVP